MGHVIGHVVQAGDRQELWDSLPATGLLEAMNSLQVVTDIVLNLLMV